MSCSVARRSAPWWLAAAVLLSTGCATLTPPAPPSAQTTQLWQAHVRAVRAHSGWTLSARITANSEDDGWSGKLYWQQDEDRYQVRFNAPFGQGGLQLLGGPQQVEMRTSDGQYRVAADAETLLYQQMGWRLPLGNLRYWVRGIPVPASHDMPVLDLDETGRLTRLQQSHWQIEYPAYVRAAGVMLPRKIYLQNDDLNVRLVIDRWGPATRTP